MLIKSIRSLGRDWATTACALTTIAVAVGANMAIFGIVNALWFRPLPVRDPATLVVAYRSVATSTDGAMLDSFASRFRPALERVPAFAAVTFQLNTGGRLGSEWLPVLKLPSDGVDLGVSFVAHDYFSVLGVELLGRPFREDEDAAEAPAVGVISDAFWREHLDQRGEVLGSTISTSRGPVQIIGIARSGFRGARLGEQTDLWLPLGVLGRFSDLAAHRSLERLTPVSILARVHEDTSVAAARDQVEAVTGDRVTLHPLRTVPFRLRAEGDLLRQDSLLSVLWVTAFLVLLIGCANLSALLVARGEARKQEVAIRLSLGAQRSTIIASVLVEASVLGAAGLGLGVLVHSALLASIRTYALPSGVVVGTLNTSLSWPTVLLGVAVTGVATTLAVASPALGARKTDLCAVLTIGDRAGPSPRTMLVRQVLLSSHVGLCCALLVGAMSLVFVMARAATADLGFARDNVLFVTVRPRLLQYTMDDEENQARRRHDYRSLMTRLGTLAGVASVTYGPTLLLVGEERPQHDQLESAGVSVRAPIMFLEAGPGYVSELGAVFLGGRDLDAADADRYVAPVDALARRFGIGSGEGSAMELRIPAVVVDSTLAEMLWPGENAVGKTFRRGLLNLTYEVVGVVRTIDHDPLVGGSVATAITYRPLDVGDGTGGVDLMVRTVGPASMMVRPIAASVRELFPDPAVLRIRTTDEIVMGRTGKERLAATVLVWYGVVSTVLALVGVYGLVSYIVSRTRREFGIRAALGASPWMLSRSMVRWILRPVGAGVAAGVLLALIGSRLLDARINGLQVLEPLAYVAGVITIIAPALGAAALGVRETSRRDPAALLRWL